MLLYFPSHEAVSLLERPDSETARVAIVQEIYMQVCRVICALRESSAKKLVSVLQHGKEMGLDLVAI